MIELGILIGICIGIGIVIIVDSMVKIAVHIMNRQQHNKTVKEVTTWKVGRQ